MPRCAVARRHAQEWQTHPPELHFRTPRFSQDEAAIKILFTTGIKPNARLTFLCLFFSPLHPVPYVRAAANRRIKARRGEKKGKTRKRRLAFSRIRAS